MSDFPFLRLPQVLERVPVSRSCWYSWIRAGHAPAPVQIGPRAVAWRRDDIERFVAERCSP